MISLLAAIFITCCSYYYVARHGIKYLGQYRSITALYSQNKFRPLFRKALLYSAIGQIVFINFLNIPGSNYLLLGRILFTIGALAGIALILIPISEYFYSHWVAAGFYFVGLTFGAIFTTLALDSNTLKLVCLLPIILWFLSMPYFLLRKNWAYKIELSHMFVAYAWMLIISISILLR